MFNQSDLYLLFYYGSHHYASVFNFPLPILFHVL